MTSGGYPDKDSYFNDVERVRQKAAEANKGEPGYGLVRVRRRKPTLGERVMKWLNRTGSGDTPAKRRYFRQ